MICIRSLYCQNSLFYLKLNKTPGKFGNNNKKKNNFVPEVCKSCLFQKKKNPTCFYYRSLTHDRILKPFYDQKKPF